MGGDEYKRRPCRGSDADRRDNEIEDDQEESWPVVNGAWQKPAPNSQEPSLAERECKKDYPQENVTSRSWIHVGRPHARQSHNNVHRHEPSHDRACFAGNRSLARVVDVAQPYRLLSRAGRLWRLLFGTTVSFTRKRCPQGLPLR